MYIHAANEGVFFFLLSKRSGSDKLIDQSNTRTIMRWYTRTETKWRESADSSFPVRDFNDHYQSYIWANKDYSLLDFARVHVSHY